MKISSAAFTVAALSLLSTSHAAPLTFKNGEISGRLHHRRGSDISDVSSFQSTPVKATEALDELDVSFEPASSLILPRILNFIKRQVSTGASLTSSSSQDTEETTETDPTSTTSPQYFGNSVMSPDYESYGFASESGPGSALAPVREIKE